MKRVGLLLGSCALLAGCAAGETQATTGSGGESSSGPTGGGGSGGSQPSCDDFTNTAPVIQESEVAGAVPPATGGKIADGTYFQTGDIKYTTEAPGPPDEQIRGTLVIAGPLWRRLYADGADVAAGNDRCIVWNVAPSSTELTIQTTDGTLTFSYSATLSQLALYSGSNALTYAIQ